MDLRLSAFFASTTLRVTVSTSASDSSTGIVKRGLRRCNKGTLPARAVWPAPMSKTLLSSCLQMASAISITSVERCGLSPMNNWISSSTITVHGISPFMERTLRTIRINSSVEISVTTGNWARSAARACLRSGAKAGSASNSALARTGLT